jgi:DNA (cytosine-5)-methyltransferase 1
MGWETVAFVEKDKFCQKVLRKNFGRDIEIHDDITTFSGKPFCGRVDIITGGFPCQPFSAAGKRKGRDDERHLFPAMLDVIRDVRPTWCVLENVRGLLSIESGRVFSDVISQLESEGFEVVTFCVPASAVGAPHRRDRLWIVAHAHSFGERTGHREVQGTDGEVSERHDDAEPLAERDCDAENAISERGGIGTPEEPVGIRIERDIGAGNGVGLHQLSHSTTADSTGRIRRRTGGTQSHERPQILREAETQGKADQLNGSNSNASNAHIIGQPRPRKLAGRGDTAASGEGEVDRTFDDDEPEAGWREPWPQVAARLCRMDARVSQRVDRLKSLGNSIVPQIAFEIFKAIEASEKENNASA